MGVRFFYGYIIIATSGTTMVATMIGHTTGINMAVNHLVEDLNITRTTVSFIWLCSLFISAMGLPFAGWFLDNWGARRLTLYVSGPFVVAVFCMGLVTNAINLAVCIVVIRFLGPECLLLASQVTPNKWFIRKRGRVTAILSIFDAASAAFGSLFQFLISLLGWRRAYFTLSVLIAVALVLVCVFIRDSPEVMGLLPDNDTHTIDNDNGQKKHETVELASVSLKRGRNDESDHHHDDDNHPSLHQPTKPSALHDHNSHKDRNGNRSGQHMTFREILCSSLFWAITISVAMFNLFWSGFNYHSADVMFMTAGLTASETANGVFVPLAFAVGVSAFLMGLLLDHLSSFRRLVALALVYVGLAGCMLLLLIIDTLYGSMVFALFYGAFVGSQMSLMVPMFAHFFGTKDLGKVQGVGVGFVIFSSGCGPVLFGLSKDWWGSYTTAIIICASSTILSSLIIFIIVLRMCLLPNPAEGYMAVSTAPECEQSDADSA